jgi:hypothetical protein
MDIIVTQPDTISVTAAAENAFEVVVTPAPAITVTASTTGATGIQGPAGPQGDAGPTGPAGPGVPTGGLTGQRLVKKSDTAYDTEWAFLSATPAGNDKAIQFNDGGVMGGNDDLRFDKNTKALLIGISGALPENPLAIGRSVNSFLQANIQNTNEGAEASSDWVATADNGDNEAFYVDMGINSSVFDSEDFPLYEANDAYVLNDGGDLILNPMTPGKSIVMAVGGVEVETIVAEFAADGVTLPDGYGITNRPEIFYGTGSPPSATGKADGTLFFKYTP